MTPGSYEQFEDSREDNIEIVTVNGKTTYTINGKKYHSLADIPPDMRENVDRLCALRDNIKRPYTHHETTFEINGVTYNSLEDIPPELSKLIPGSILDRAAAQQATALPAANLESSRDELHRKIVASRPEVKHNYRIVSSTADSNPYLHDVQSRRAVSKIAGFFASAIAYAALILWSQLSPAGWGSYLFISFLVGDIASKIILGHYGHHEEIVKPGLKNFILQAVGVIFFVILVNREGVFDGPIKNQVHAVAVIVFLSVVAFSLKSPPF